MIYDLHKPTIKKVPILISVPHCGLLIPDELKSNYKEKALESLDDADWFVDQLYDFAASMGITMISARYHRWLIDLNRNPESKPLYGDGRVITGLCPSTDFNGKKVYKSNCEPSPKEIESRIKQYYQPYYDKINELLGELQTDFKHVLFFDAHSIRQFVPGVHKDKFPDLILGDVDQTSASKELINIVDNMFSLTSYSYAHNYPFKGGNLTRHFGNPSQNRHALQLEMSKLAYMDDDETKYSGERADKMRVILKTMFERLILTLNKLNTTDQ